MDFQSQQKIILLEKYVKQQSGGLAPGLIPTSMTLGIKHSILYWELQKAENYITIIFMYSFNFLYQNCVCFRSSLLSVEALKIRC